MPSPSDPSGASSHDAPLPAGAFLLRPMVQEIVGLTATTMPEQTAADAPLIVVDVDRGHTVDADAATVRRVLGMLIRDAVVASSQPLIDGVVPLVREVVITSVSTPERVEIEIADSSGTAAGTIGMAAGAARSIVERLGGGFKICRCPEGGKAVVLSFPRRDAGQRAGGAGLRRAA